jgi:hypothetical protein
MLIKVQVGVQHPDAVDTAALLKIFPYGPPSITVVKGGLDMPRLHGAGLSVIANVALMVLFDMGPRNGGKMPDSGNGHGQ